jgi:hypothetical protein
LPRGREVTFGRYALDERNDEAAELANGRKRGKAEVDRQAKPAVSVENDP